MATRDLIETLKENEQDFEWYPTTDEMIQVVLRQIPEKALSLMDIGAGDGRVLKRFQEKCNLANLYSIEKSSILMQEQDKEIIPVGTDFYEQNLRTLPVDYIFCNPIYSEYVEWVLKIIAEGFAKKAFVIIPQRWSDNKEIKKALGKRGADARVLWIGDFYKAERQARAVVDIVEIRFPTESLHWEKIKDPFDIWFDQNISTFEKVKEDEDEEQTEAALARKYKHATIDEMVEAYLEEFARLQRNYQKIFELDLAILDELGIQKDAVRQALKMKMSGLKNKYWEILFKRLDAITSRLTTKSKNKLLEKLTSNRTVEFTASNAYAVVIWAIKNANQYFDDQLVQLFEDLATFEGVEKYKSNIQTWEKGNWRWNRKDRKYSHYKLDYRIVLDTHQGIFYRDKSFTYSEWEYPGGLYKERHDTITDIIAVMSNLGFKTYSLKSYDREWKKGQWQDWYEENSNEILFQTKAYLNGNMHFRFMPEAIKALNIEAARILKWVRTAQEVVEEMGYTPADVKKYWKGNIQITANNLPLLGAGSPKMEPIEEMHESIEELPDDLSQGKLFQ
jgi:hypothetical protein